MTKNQSSTTLALVSWLLLSTGCSAVPAVNPLQVSSGEVCAVHGDILLEGTAPIIYGFIEIDPSMMIAMQEFPRAHLRIEGGCLASYDKDGKLVSRAKVEYCQRCREGRGAAAKIEDYRLRFGR